MFAFTSRKNRQQAQQFLVRMLNERSLAAAKVSEQRRQEARADLSVGIWIVPFNEGQPDIDGAIPGVTKDLTSMGVGVMANQPVRAEEVLLCLPSEDGRKFLRAKVCSGTPLGAGWFQYGMAVIEIASEGDYPQLNHLGKSLSF